MLVCDVNLFGKIASWDVLIREKTQLSSPPIPLIQGFWNMDHLNELFLPRCAEVKSWLEFGHGLFMFLKEADIVIVRRERRDTVKNRGDPFL